MNEKLIKDLLLDATETWDDWESGNSHTQVDYMAFAELVVHECLSVLNKRYMGDQNREDMEVRRCIKDIEDHFGMKE